MADLSITASAVRGTSTRATGTAGATITAGQVVYLDAADNKYKLADNDNTAATGAVGIALHGSLDGQPLVVLTTGGELTVNAVLTAGTSYYLSSTPGGICPFADLNTSDRIVRLGWAKSTTVLVVDIEDTAVVL